MQLKYIGLVPVAIDGKFINPGTIHTLDFQTGLSLLESETKSWEEIKEFIVNNNKMLTKGQTYKSK